MNSVRFPAPWFDQLAQSLYHETLESAAILICQPLETAAGETHLLVRDMRIAKDWDYVERTSLGLTLATGFCLAAEQRAVREGLSLVYCHTHPHFGAPTFSDIDDSAEKILSAYLTSRRANSLHGALLLSKDCGIGRELGSDAPLRIVEIGADYRLLSGAAVGDINEEHDRQVRAFGPVGQAKISALRVAIIGLGGTGSLVVQQLAHLGVSRFIIVDPDRVDTTNLNRLVGALPEDAGVTAKVAVGVRLIRALQPMADVEAVAADVTNPATAKKIANADFIFNCTDTHASRHLVNQLAYQYLIPVIDMGVSISVGADGGAQFAGHSKMLAPGLACLWCARHLNADLVRQELLTEVQRAADPYVLGAEGIVQPSVISLNSTVASLSVTMFLAAVARVPSKSRYLYYDGNRGRVSTLDSSSEAGCPFCGDDAPIGWGEANPLPVRND